MAITYEYTKALALKHATSLKVTRWLIEMTATDDADNVIGIVTMTIVLDPVDQKVFGSWTGSEVKALADAERSANSWESIANSEITYNRDRASVEEMDASLLV